MGAHIFGPPPWVTDPDERLEWSVWEVVSHRMLPPPPPGLQGEELRAWALAGLKAKDRTYVWALWAIVLIVVPILIGVYIDLSHGS